MLVLTRKVGESVVIGNNIRVTVLAIMNSRIRIGVEAPSDVQVFREELVLELDKEGTPTKTNLGN